MSDLVVGPLLRHVGQRHATIFVETSVRGVVAVDVHDGDGEQVATTTTPTATVSGHHYALVVLEGLPPGATLTYTVDVDGERVWPDPAAGLPPSRIRLDDADRPARIAFGSCESAGPQTPPWTLHQREHPQGLGPDALCALGRSVIDGDRAAPDLLLLLGDQVYADSGAPEFREWVASVRDVSEPPGDDALTFDEYAELYRRSWGEPTVRWLLSTVPTAMIFDDHEVIDDWNISRPWVEEIRATSWWRTRITNALATYWLYQHLGNLSPAELDAEPMARSLRAGDDLTDELLSVAAAWDRGGEPTPGHRWSHARQVGGTTVVVVDSRNGRLLDPRRRRMVDDAEQAWVDDVARRARGHLVIASSVPWLLSPGVHNVERWCSAVADGVWGARAARRAERLRQAADLEHWAAFPASWEHLADLVEDLVRSDEGPDSVLVVSGDVHHSYAAPLRFPGGPHRPVWQLVSSPLRYPVPSKLERAITMVETVVGDLAGRTLARAAGLRPPQPTWRVEVGPMHHNGVAVLGVDGARATVAFLAARSDGEVSLETVHEIGLA